MLWLWCTRVCTLGAPIAHGGQAPCCLSPDGQPLISEQSPATLVLRPQAD